MAGILGLILMMLAGHEVVFGGQGGSWSGSWDLE